MRSRLIVSVLLLVCAVAQPRTANAQESVTEATLRAPGVIDYVAMAAMVGTIAGLTFAPRREEPRARGPVLFDDTFRNGWRAESSVRRQRFRRASDVSLALLLALPLADTFVMAGQRDWRTSGRLAFSGAQAFAVSGMVASLLKVLVARQRPDARECEADTSCDVSDIRAPNHAFPSGHTAFAFTGAALACSARMRHTFIGRGADIATCASGLVLATLTGIFRGVSDRHWATDVLVGAGVGLLAGFLVPRLYWRSGEPDDPTISALSVGFDRRSFTVGISGSL